MSTGFSKKKEKRSRSSSSEANTSFVKNVTARVSGLLPATITKWFSSPSSSNANGSTQTADATDSSTEDEASETPVITQPPAKRMRFNAPGKYNQYESADASCSTSSEVTDIATYSSYRGTQFAPTRNTITTTPLRNPNDYETTKDNSDKDKSVYKTQTQHTVAGIGKSIANKRKSIFETSTINEDTTKACKKPSQNNMQDLKKPYFKPSLLGSPFYSGRTMYGGAASSYINEPNIRQHQVALVNESKSNDDTALSSSARRIMDLLESYSSPLMEARRIPQYTRPKNDSLNISGRYNPISNRTISNRTQELYVPSIASILRLKKKSRLMDTTNAARQIIASHSSASNYPLNPVMPQPGRDQEKESNKMTTKVKPKLTRTHRGSHNELEMSTPVKLPDAVLQIDQDNLPNFSFDNPAINKLPTTSTPKVSIAENKNNSEVPFRKVETKTSRTFKFSKPVRISCDAPEPVTTLPKFTFDSPERQIDNINKKNDTPSVPSKPKESEMSASAGKDWQCGDCWVKNKSDVDKCLCCGGKKPTAALKCSICKVADCPPQKDKCAACVQIVPLKVSSLTTINTTPTIEAAVTWKCEDCWVSNTNTDKCVCCGSKKPISNVKPALSAASDTAQWKCGDCWVINKPSETKCVACGGRKPGSEAGTPAPALPNSNILPKSDVKQNAMPKSKWECSSCLVNNDIEKKNCVCCGSPYQKPTNEVKYSFGKGLSSFKFGIDPSAQEVTVKKTDTTPVCAAVEKPKENSETNNNILNETPTFTFGIPPKKIDTKIDVPKDTTTPSFTFGLPKQSATPNITAKQQEPAKSIEAENEEKPQEVPSVNFKSITEIKSMPTNNIFTSSMTSKANEDKSSSSVSTSLNLLAGTSKDTLTKPISSAPTVPSLENVQQAKTFSFGVKVNTFSSPATTSNTSNLFANPLVTSAATTSASSVTSPSLFSPAQVTTSQSTAVFKPPESTPSLFTLVQKSEPSATSTPVAPVFSFGSNLASTPTPAPSTSAAPALDKTKFQFSFGSNTAAKSEAPVLFKSPFGSGSESNTFSLGSAGTGGANALGASNGLPVTNGLTVGNLSGNTMSGNGLSGNTLVPNPLTGGTNVPLNNPLGGANGLSSNPLTTGNGSQSGNTISGMFSNTVQKENVWSAGGVSATNPFVSNNSTNSLQKPAFTFGSSTPFNATTATPAFGNNPAPVPNIFGLGNQNNSQQSMFTNPIQSQPTTNIFGSAPAPNNQNQPIIFGTPNIAPAPAFGSPNTSIPSFETPSQTPAPFSFGVPQSSGIFGFGQQASAAPQAGVYSFGGAPQVQFNMGSGANANPAVRRVRKAVRKNPQR